MIPLSQLPPEELHYLCRKSPNIYAAYVIGLDQASVHVDLQRHFTKYPSCYCEEHRGMGKTTQVSAVRCTWEIGNDPGVRIKYVMQNDTESRKSCGMMREIIESDRFRQVFPMCRPDKDQWAGDAFKVRDISESKKISFSRDPTVEGRGIFGRASGRADILVADDICDWKNAIKSPTDRASVKDAWTTNWIPMLDASSPRQLREWKVGTCYHVDDITADWRDYHKEDGSLHRRPVEDFVSPWDEVWTREKLMEKRKKMGPVAYARAYELSPISSEVIIFPKEWLDNALYRANKIPSWDRSNGKMVATLDWAYSEKKQGDDPDWSVCLIAWMSDNGHIYVQDMVKGRWTFPEFLRKAIAECVRLGVKHAWAEGNGPQKGIVQQANAQAPFPIMGLERDRDKVIRATEQQPFMESGRFHLQGEPDQFGVMRCVKPQMPIYDELTTFPASGHDDIVDTVVDMMAQAITRKGKIKIHQFDTRSRMMELRQM